MSIYGFLLSLIFVAGLGDVEVSKPENSGDEEFDSILRGHSQIIEYNSYKLNTKYSVSSTAILLLDQGVIFTNNDLNLCWLSWQ